MIRNYVITVILAVLFQTTLVFAGTTGSEDLSKSQSKDTAKECFEGVSRAMFKFNHALDNVIFEPVAKGYRALPAPIRKGTGNAVDNLRSLLTLSNNVLQGDFRKAGHTAGRFAVNTTVGILGICLYFTAAIIVIPTIPRPAQLAYTNPTGINLIECDIR